MGKGSSSKGSSGGSGRYYGVANGRQTGVFNNWDNCKPQVEGYSRNEYISTGSKAEAKDFSQNFMSSKDTK